jgi:hypothetical protein
MEVIIDLELQKRIKLGKYDFREVKLLFNTVKTLEKSFSGQYLRTITHNNVILKLMEKRATRSYRVYFLIIVNGDNAVVLDIVHKKYQYEYIKKVESNIDSIFKRNFDL